MSDIDSDFSDDLEEDSSDDSSDWSEDDSYSEDSDSSYCSDDRTPRKRTKITPATDNSTDWIWQNKDNVPQIKTFVGNPGIDSSVLHRQGENASARTMFEEVCDDSFWQTLTSETNRYAQQTMKDGTNKKKMDEKWSPVTVDEMKAYIALSIIMSQVKKSSVKMNWSKRSIIQTPIFSQTMPFQRFVAITRFLHFSNNETAKKTDKMNKIRDAVNYFNDKFRQIYTPKGDVSIDESLMKFKGRLENVVFCPKKRARYGVKFYKLCESDSGYCCGFKIYTSQDTTPDDTEFGKSGNVVLSLMDQIIKKGYTLFLDNWYSSPNLYEHLLANDANVIGTVRSNRTNMPKELQSLKLKKGEVEARSSHGILALKWIDRKDVYMLSTKHTSPEMTDTGKKRILKGGKREEKNVMKPKCVIEYNSGMGGVDRQDQRLACFPIMRKFRKGYRKIFFYMLDMAIFNSYVLYCKLKSNTKMQYVSYRLDVAEQILHNITLPDYNCRGRPAQSDTPLRLQSKRWAHFPRHITPTEKKAHPTRVCKVCSKHKKRSETSWECKKCLVALHVPGCFEAYHTLHNY